MPVRSAPSFAVAAVTLAWALAVFSLVIVSIPLEKRAEPKPRP
jgi:hypothetical protein